MTEPGQQTGEELDYLRLHCHNLEAELRHLARLPARIRELERALAEARSHVEYQEGALRYAQHMQRLAEQMQWRAEQHQAEAERLYRAVINSRSWRATEPFRALRRRLPLFRRP